MNFTIQIPLLKIAFTVYKTGYKFLPRVKMCTVYYVNGTGTQRKRIEKLTRYGQRGKVGWENERSH